MFTDYRNKSQRLNKYEPSTLKETLLAPVLLLVLWVVLVLWFSF